MKKTLTTATLAVVMATTAFSASASDNRTTLNFHLNESLIEGSEALSAGDYEKASNDFRRALRHNLGKAERLAAANNLCISEQALGNFEAALKACKLAVRTDRHSWQAHLNLGDVQVAMGDKEAGVKSWNRAMSKSRKAREEGAFFTASRNSESSRLAMAGK